LPEPAPPRVFISYSHDSETHADQVLALAERLLAEGVDASIDQYIQSPPEGWPAWCEAEIRKADFVLMVCTETYLRRVNREEEAGKGHGALWEARLIRQYLYDSGSVSSKFVPVLFADGLHDYVPTPVKGGSIYRVQSDEGYEGLYRLLTNQPRVRKGMLGRLRRLPERQRVSLGEPPVGAAAEIPPVPVASLPRPRVEDLFVGRAAERQKLTAVIPADGNGKASAKPKVFISYSWLDEKDKDGNPVVLAHERRSRTPDERAFSLAELLREHGFDSRIDLYFKDAKYGFVPPVVRSRDRRDPWIIWAQEQIAEADSVLLLCTPEYIASDLDHGECPGEWCDWHRMDNVLKAEKRVPSLWWDWHYIAEECDAKPEKFIPVGFGSYSPEEIPAFVRGATYCNLDSRRDFEGLLRRIREEHRRRHPSAASGGAEQPEIQSKTPERLPGLTTHSTTQLHVVILVHGIRDFALWQTTIRSALEEESFKAEATNYGRFNLLQFLVPFSYFRKKAIATVWNQIRIVKQNNEGALLSVVAHSFGTFVIAHLIQENFDIKFHRVIFCGSVVRYGFPFEQFQNRFAQPIVNEVGTRDIWPAMAESITFGYGSAGTYGFRRPLVRDRWHNEAHHGYFLDPLFCKKYWIPFLKNGEVVAGAAAPEPHASGYRSCRL